MIKEHDHVVLVCDLPEVSLRKGDVGVAVHVNGKGKSFIVEFIGLDGYTIALATLEAKQVRAVRKNEIAHARTLKVSEEASLRLL